MGMIENGANIPGERDVAGLGQRISHRCSGAERLVGVHGVVG
jgi:hypothetical protein